MTEPRKCPQCGAELPSGSPGNLCAPCALRDAQERLDENGAVPTEDLAPVSTIRLEIPSDKPGDKIGAYKLLEEIGEGGMGSVWMAHQEKPVYRRVAIKLIKLGMDTRHVIARFEAERQALAMMDHPNIARILDAGATENGRPFFVMELVRGIPITEYCDQHKLSTRERIELFVPVCEAIQHAHSKLIVHRDIKPSNILVALSEGDKPLPKVIDFGIAKAIGQFRLTDKTVFTGLREFIGTYLYMSPEQAQLTALDIDTRSDIYSLGVVLYQLLTGKTPFDASRLRDAGLDEIRRIIREEEPPRPSTRLSTLNLEEQTKLAKQRQVEPPKLLGLISGDLDWIVMKCLDKDRRRRYETANILAMDIQRHLSNEPVVARPPSQLYRLGKMVRRNKLAFASASAVACALMLGSVVSTWLFLKEKQARQQTDAAIARVTERDRRIADLEAQNDVVEKRLLVTADAINQLSLQLADTKKKLGSEGDQVPLEKEIHRLMAEKAELEGQFNDLTVLRAQVARLKEEFAISRRLEWARQGLFSNAELKGAQILLTQAENIVRNRVEEGAVARIPLIVMDEVSLDDAIGNLARTASVKYVLDDQIAYGQPGSDGKITPWPKATLRLENATASEALRALLMKYELQLVLDPVSTVARIKRAGRPESREK